MAGNSRIFTTRTGWSYPGFGTTNMFAANTTPLGACTTPFVASDGETYYLTAEGAARAEALRGEGETMLAASQPGWLLRAINWPGEQIGWRAVESDSCDLGEK